MLIPIVIKKTRRRLPENHSGRLCRHLYCLNVYFSPYYPCPCRLYVCAFNSSCNVKKGPQKQPHVMAPCSETECSAKRQQELIDCLTYEAIVSQNLDEQLALNVQSLDGQLVAATDDRERLTVLLFEMANRMNTANCEYRQSVVAADTATRQLAEQREVVRDFQALVYNLTAMLSDAKTSMATYVQQKQDTDEFSVYATGNRPKNN